MRAYVRALLDAEKMTDAALLLWGEGRYNPDPQCVKDVVRNIRNNKALLILGAAKMSKTYTAGAYFYLDWQRDPYNTMTKVVSCSTAHAETNLFAHLLELHRETIIPMVGIARRDRILADPNDKRSGMELLTVPQQNSGKGRLRGLAPRPRTTPHPKFPMTRVRVILDEAELLPEGIWEDVDNMLLAAFDEEHVKIVGATNPIDINSEYCRRCKPPGGWFDIGTKSEWMSEAGFQVLHLDAAQCENVVQQKVVFPGLQTFEGFERLRASSGGEASPTWWSQARGWPPTMGSKISVIPPNIFNAAKGEYVFVGEVERGLAWDLALTGDKITGAHGRCGRAVGWENDSGEFIKFAEPRPALQVDGYMEIPGGDTVEVADRIFDITKSMLVKPRFVIFDRTGNGSGVYDILKKPTRLGPEIRAVHFAEGCTRRKIMEDDEEIAEQLYYKIHTEVWFAARKMMEFGAVKIGKNMWVDSDLFIQMTDRLYGPGPRGLTVVEPKDEYKRRHEKKSPDKADSINLLVHDFRLNDILTARMLAGKEELFRKEKPTRQQRRTPKFSVVDRHNYMRM